MYKDFYKLNLNDYITYSLEFKEEEIKLTIYYVYGKSDNIVFDKNNKKFNTYEGENENFKKVNTKISQEKLKENFIEGLTTFSNNSYSIEPINHEDIKHNKLIEKINKLLKEIK